ncbi:MAG: DUF1501 domain-containing protein [Phycisphaerales bacterium]|nr:DUF1501 domain-containing protein [Phycisphaerales bacterium]
MDCCRTRQYLYTRRDALRSISSGFGLLAFAGLAAAQDVGGSRAPGAGGTSDNPLAPKAGHFAAKAKRVIFLCMAGGPSHLDTFDYKPDLISADGQSYAGRGRQGARLLAPPWKFKQYGRSGLWVSDLFAQTAKHADEMCLLRSMHTDVPAHAQAMLKTHTGSFQFVRPSLGAWSLYGLGTLNSNLPGFVVINPRASGAGTQTYGSAFLPAAYQGSEVNVGAAGRRGQRADRGQAEAYPNIAPVHLSEGAQREQLDFVQKLNREELRREGGDDQVEGVIGSYELAFRMQAEIPEVIDISDEKQSTLEEYGIGEQASDGFGRQCLLARRLAEKGVRFIEVTQGGWDTHRNMREDLERQSAAVDKPVAALLADLKRRGMLKDTLVIWGGEFGRTPYAQNGDGRDHNHKGYTMWMAGGGVKGGMSYGSTDELGYESVDNKMHIHDWHATVLHLMGLDHEKLTYNYAGRDFRLTEVYGNVAKGIIA